MEKVGGEKDKKEKLGSKKKINSLLKHSNLQRFSNEQCAILHYDVSTKQISAHCEIEANIIISGFLTHSSDHRERGKATYMMFCVFDQW